MNGMLETVLTVALLVAILLPCAAIICDVCRKLIEPEVIEIRDTEMEEAVDDLHAALIGVLHALSDGMRTIRSFVQYGPNELPDSGVPPDPSWLRDHRTDQSWVIAETVAGKSMDTVAVHDAMMDLLISPDPDVAQYLGFFLGEAELEKSLEEAGDWLEGRTLDSLSRVERAYLRWQTMLRQYRERYPDGGAK